MICPRCETSTLVTHQRGGMEVDVCSACRGVWLDRGELERLALTPPAPASAGLVDDVHGSEPESESKSESESKDSESKSKKEKKKRKPKSLGARVADALDDVFDDIFDDVFD